MTMNLHNFSPKLVSQVLQLCLVAQLSVSLIEPASAIGPTDGGTVDKIPTKSGTTKNAAESTNRRPPAIPENFDNDTVSKLIDTIESPHHAAFLKMGLFTRSRPGAIGPAEGYDQVKTALAKENPGTQRWFLLKGVAAYAALHVPSLPAEKGFLEYNEIFQNADKAISESSQYALRSIISEYVNMASGYFTIAGLAGLPQAGSTLFTAWDAKRTLDRRLKPGMAIRTRDPWTSAIKEVQSEDSFRARIDKEMASAKPSPDYDVFKIAAVLYGDVDRQKATGYLELAKGLLPEADLHEKCWYFEQLANWKCPPSDHDPRHVADAVKVYNDMIRSTGQGYRYLIGLLIANDRWADIDTIMQSLSPMTVNEVSLMELASTIFEPGAVGANESDETAATSPTAPSSATAKQLVVLLEQYLTNHRVRTPEGELGARIILAEYFLAQNQPDQANAALSIPVLPSPTSPRLRAQRRKIQRLLIRIDQKIETSRQKDSK